MEQQFSADVRVADHQDAAGVAAMVGELLIEIMAATGTAAFEFNPTETRERLERFIAAGKYFVFAAWTHEKPVGFITLYESYALYAQGAYGTIPELYVRPPFRAAGIGELLLRAAKELAVQKSWVRLEVTTPPLPEFSRTLQFYEKNGFEVTGGRKLKWITP